LLQHTVSAANTHRFLSLLGQVWYQHGTGLVHPMTSILAQHSANPTTLDWYALVKVALFEQTIGHLPLSFYKAKVPRDISDSMELHGYTDVGLVDGQARGGLLLKAGPVGSEGGPFHSLTKSTTHTRDTASDEASMLSQIVGYIHTFRWLFEELAGKHPDPYNSSFVNDADPTAILVREETGQDIIAHDVGTYGLPAIMAEKFKTRASPSSLHTTPPTVVYQDSNINQEVANSNCETNKLKSLRPILRCFNQIFQGIKDRLLCVLPCTSAQNHANSLTKIPQGPLFLSRSLPGSLGYSTAVHEYTTKQQAKYGKSKAKAAEQEDGEVEEAMDVDADTTPVVLSPLHPYHSQPSSQSSPHSVPSSMPLPFDEDGHAYNSNHMNTGEGLMHTSTSGMHATSSFNLSSIHASPLYKNFVNASTNQQTSAQAAWLHTTNNQSINVMRAHGYSNDVDRIAADDSRLNVYRPGTKVPSNKLGLGYALATSQSQSIHAYAANTVSTQEPYTAAHNTRSTLCRTSILCWILP
jgi:hypothetical protein